MIVVAIVSLVATVAIPLMTKAVIDGPVRHQDQHGLWVLGSAAMARRRLRGGAVVHPALAGGPRHHGRRGRHPQGPLRPAADPADVVSRAVAVRPAAVANHERPEHDSSAAVVRPGVPDAQRPADHRRHRHPAGDVLAAGCGRAGLDRADHADRAALRAQFTRLSRQAQDQAGHVATHVEESALGSARGQVVRPRGLRLRPVRRAGHRPLRHPGPQGRRCRRSSGPCWRSSRTSR